MLNERRTENEFFILGSFFSPTNPLILLHAGAGLGFSLARAVLTSEAVTVSAGGENSALASTIGPFSYLVLWFDIPIETAYAAGVWTKKACRPETAPCFARPLMTRPLVTCPHCFCPAHVPDGYLGTALRCPQCNQLFQRQPTTFPPMQRVVPPSRSGATTVPQTSKWCVLRDGKSLGPYPLEMLQQLAESGDLKADAWLVMADTDVSVLAATVPGLLFRPKRSGQRLTTVPVAAAAPVASVRLPQRNNVTPAARKPEVAAAECPTCRVKCLVPKPQSPTLFTCPKCRQPFRAASTPTGIVAQRVGAILAPVR